MAWVTPRTWVIAEVVTAALFNAQIRDNFLVASTHAHSGAPGDGNDELGGLDSATFDFVGDPAAPGASKVILYTKAGGLFYREGAAGAVLQVSDTAHTHVPTSQATEEVDTQGTSDEQFGFQVNLTTSEVVMETDTVPALGGNDRANSIVACCGFGRREGLGGTSNCQAKIFVNSVEKAALSFTINGSGTAHVKALQYLDPSPVATQLVQLKAFYDGAGSASQFLSGALAQRLVKV